MLCGGRKKSPRLHLSVVIFFLVLREQRLQQCNCLELNTASAVARGREQCCMTTLLFVNRLNKSESVISPFVVLLVFPKGHLLIVLFSSKYAYIQMH